MPFSYSRSVSEKPAFISLILALVLLSMVPVSASATDVMLGWTRSDVGLDGHDEGLSFSAVHYLPMGSNDAFDIGLELAYVQRAGSQPGIFTSEILGSFEGEGQVTLHILQPGLTLGYSLNSGGWIWRAYAGGAVGLKLEESWDLPEGDWMDPYGYEDLDFLGLVGVTATVGRMVLDVRYCAGLTEQLILRNDLGYPTTKAAEDAFPGVEDPEAGARLSNFQLGAGFTF